jgi:hypothetical protein
LRGLVAVVELERSSDVDNRCYLSFMLINVRNQ